MAAMAQGDDFKLQSLWPLSRSHDWSCCLAWVLDENFLLVMGLTRQFLHWFMRHSSSFDLLHLSGRCYHQSFVRFLGSAVVPESSFTCEGFLPPFKAAEPVALAGCLCLSSRCWFSSRLKPLWPSTCKIRCAGCHRPWTRPVDFGDFGGLLIFCS